MQRDKNEMTETRRQPGLSQGQAMMDMIVTDPKNKCNLYRGKRTKNGVVVIVQYGDMPEKELPLRLDLRSHSPDGFEWGYGGSGPAQLALAILAFEYDERIAQYFYEEFKWEVISRLPKGEWTLSSEQIAATMLEISRELAGSQLVVA